MVRKRDMIMNETRILSQIQIIIRIIGFVKDKSVYRSDGLQIATVLGQKKGYDYTVLDNCQKQIVLEEQNFLDGNFESLTKCTIFQQGEKKFENVLEGGRGKASNVR